MIRRYRQFDRAPKGQLTLPGHSVISTANNIVTSDTHVQLVCAILVAALRDEGKSGNAGEGSKSSLLTR